MVQPDKPHVTIWRMRIAWWIPKTTNTHSEYVILIAFPQQQWLHERVWMHVKCASHSQLNWAILLFEGNSAGLRTVFSSRLSNRELRSSLRESHISSVYLSTPLWHHLKAHPFLANHSADEHRIIYSSSNTTSYSTFYAFFSSFRITLWPMWLANSKRQPCFVHHSHTHKKTHRTDKKKLTNLMGNLCCAREIQFSFSCSFFHTVELHSLTLGCIGPFIRTLPVLLSSYQS
jgi:hypothetical protein